MNIDREVGKLPGVASVTVDVETKKAIIKYGSPATRLRLKLAYRKWLSAREIIPSPKD
jgi:copper chaperone CopZ